MSRSPRVGLSLVIALVIGIVNIGSGPVLADPGTFWVNDDQGPWLPPGTSCEHPGFKDIQSAVDAAPAGTRINVCPGTYIEQVTIPAGKDSLQLRSVGTWQAIIKAPAVMIDPKAIVRVSGAHDVGILAFTITGPGGFGCDSIRWGVRVDSGGSADILGNHITQIHDTPFSGCQNGVAVVVGRFSEATTGSARIFGNLIDNYQKNGPTVSNAGSSAQISANRIFGVGPTAVIAQNGIQASGGATASIRHNFVSGNVYTPQTFASTGILLFQSGAVTVDHNTVNTNDVGIYGFLQSAGTAVTMNRARTSTFDGIIVDLSNGTQTGHNRTERNNGPGIGVYDGADSNAIFDNRVEDNKDSGILIDTGTNNTVRANKVFENGTAGPDTTDGIRINVGSGNTIDSNDLRDNITHDCHDNSAPANTWTNNRGETSQPPGLCGRDDNDTDFAMTTTYGWDASYPWYAGMTDASTYDWSAAYATVDTDALMQLVAQLPIRARSKPAPGE